jgi:hypothetical protein
VTTHRYQELQLSFKALTPVSRNPYAVFLLADNVVSFDVSESKETKGNGYSGYLFTAGKYHIKDNMLIYDRWQEIEWKMKGDLKSPVKKLSWSFLSAPNFTTTRHHGYSEPLVPGSRLAYKPRNLPFSTTAALNISTTWTERSSSTSDTISI